MKKILGAVALVAAMAVVMPAAQAQESRQDVSASFIGVYAPDVNGNLVHPMHTTNTGGVLLSYRYLLTPRSGLELNYSWAQNSIKYNTVAINSGEVHTRQQEITGAYIYQRTYRNYTPFVEAGIGGYIFTPILDNGTHQLDARQNTNIGFLFGGGVAYELSPSFDIRAQYRGFLMKAPDFNVANGAFKTNRYYVLMTPSIGIAYHF